MFKLVVLDANAFWTEQLFRQCSLFADVLLLKPRDFRHHYKLNKTLLSDKFPQTIAPSIYEQKFAKPPKWMFELWPWASGGLIKAINSFCPNTSQDL